MNEYTVIILFVAANPSKDISRGRKIILRKKEEPESVDRSFQSDRPKSILISKKCNCRQAPTPRSHQSFQIIHLFNSLIFNAINPDACWPLGFWTSLFDRPNQNILFAHQIEQFFRRCQQVDCHKENLTLGIEHKPPRDIHAHIRAEPGSFDFAGNFHLSVAIFCGF